MKLLKNCRLIPELTEGFDGQMADVLIEGKLIKNIVQAGTLDVDGAEVIELQGMTLMPGLFDLHAHLMFMDQDYYASMAREQNQYVVDCMKHAQLYLQQGYTTIRDCGSDYYSGMAVKYAERTGTINCSKVIACGKIISPTTKGNECFGSLYWEIDDPKEMRHAARVEASKGVDFIKYMITGAVLNEGGVPGEMISSDEEIKALVDAAKSVGLYVAAHCHGTEGIKAAIRNGVKTIEHASYMDEECIKLIKEREDEVATIPTLAIAYTLYKELYEGGVLPEFVVKAKDACEHMAISLDMCEKAGVLVGWGTDLDLQMYERYPGLEFIARAEFGAPNIQSLKQATINSAKIVGLDHVCGSVKVGKLADLVVIDGNPDEDINVMKKRPRMVFKEGELAAENSQEVTW